MGSCLTSSKNDVSHPSKKTAPSPDKVNTRTPRDMPALKDIPRTNIPQEQNIGLNTAPKTGLNHNVDGKHFDR